VDVYQVHHVTGDEDYDVDAGECGIAGRLHLDLDRIDHLVATERVDIQRHALFSPVKVDVASRRIDASQPYTCNGTT
jgi:hypothetical protein